MRRVRWEPRSSTVRCGLSWRRSALPFAEQVLAAWSTGIVSGHLLGVIVGYGMVAYLLVAA